jgi:hypothetical protein
VLSRAFPAYMQHGLALFSLQEGHKGGNIPLVNNPVAKGILDSANSNHPYTHQYTAANKASS